MKSRSQYQIIHLSDLHLTSDEEAQRTEPRIFGALTGMNRNFRELLKAEELQKADLVVVTGDVTDTGDASAWQIFWNAVRAEGLDGRILVVPGNHDVCCLGLRLPEKGPLNGDNAKATAGLRLGQQPCSFPWAVQLTPSIVVFGINSNNLGNLTGATNAIGRISYFQLEAFARQLLKYKRTPVKIVVMHHSPNIPGSAAALRRGQRPMTTLGRLAHQIPRDQRQALRLLCIAHGVKCILHGHLHRAESRRVGGLRIIGAPASTEPIPKAKSTIRFWRYTIHNTSLRTRYQLRYLQL
jgi:3',5'-cyclic AMP phosphodiesterase CpdA